VITNPVFVFSLAFSSVFLKKTCKLTAVLKENATTALPSIMVPLSIVEIAIGKVLNACSLSLVILHIALIKLTVAEENFDLPVHDSVAVESSLNYLIRK